MVVVYKALVRQCHKNAWIESEIVLNQVIIPLVQPKAQPAKGTQEEIAASYVILLHDSHMFILSNGAGGLFVGSSSRRCTGYLGRGGCSSWHASSLGDHAESRGG